MDEKLKIIAIEENTHAVRNSDSFFVFRGNLTYFFIEKKIGDSYMSKNKKSAKDIAFERERAKFRHQIRDLEHQKVIKEQEIEKLKEKLSDYDEKIRQQEDWIRRLLEYTELSEEEMKKQIAAEKSKAEFVSRMNELGMILERFGVL